MAGEKTVTRRLPSFNASSPWYWGGCTLKPGRTYAVCPGRGKPAVGRVVVLAVDFVMLGRLTPDEARREGFADAEAFERAFALINGRYHRGERVWRVEFELAGAS
jgi:hypothetical protein